MLKAIEEGVIYSCVVPEIQGDFDVIVLEKLKYKGFLVEAINYTNEQKKLLKKKKFQLTVRASSLKEKPQTDERRIEIGKIYFCELLELEKNIEVEILDKIDQKNYMVRVIRCTYDQRKIINENYQSRFIVPVTQIHGKSINFLFG